MVAVVANLDRVETGNLDLAGAKVELVKEDTHLVMPQVQLVKVLQEDLELKEVTKPEPEAERVVKDQMLMDPEELDIIHLLQARQ